MPEQKEEFAKPGRKKELSEASRRICAGVHFPGKKMTEECTGSHRWPDKITAN